MTSIPISSEPEDPPPETPAPETCVLGDGAICEALTDRLVEGGLQVAHVDGSPLSPNRTDGRSAEAFQLTDPPIGSATTAIVATSSDARNLLLAQRLRSLHDVDRIVVLTNTPGRVEAIAAAGHEPLCATTVLADALADHL